MMMLNREEEKRKITEEDKRLREREERRREDRRRKKKELDRERKRRPIGKRKRIRKMRIERERIRMMTMLKVKKRKEMMKMRKHLNLNQSQQSQLMCLLRMIRTLRRRVTDLSMDLTTQIMSSMVAHLYSSTDPIIKEVRTGISNSKEQRMCLQEQEDNQVNQSYSPMKITRELILKISTKDTSVTVGS